MKKARKSITKFIVIAMLFILVPYLTIATLQPATLKVPQIWNNFFTKKSDYFHNVSTIKSNQWYSSIYKTFPSEPLYALPLVFKTHHDGLEFSYPKVTGTEKSVFATFAKDLSVGLLNPITDSDIQEVTDWMIKLRLSNSNDYMDFSIGHGIPYVHIASTSNMQINTSKSYTFYNQNSNTPILKKSIVTNSFIVSTNDNFYLFVLPKATKITIEENRITLDSKKVFIGLLPNRATYQDFLEIADDPIKSTGTEYELSSENLITTYRTKTEKGKQPLLALFPHQLNNLESQRKIIATYNTIRGPISLIKSSSFSTHLNVITPLTTFPSIQNPPADFIDQLKKDIASSLAQPIPTSKNYFLGTYFGKIVSLIQLAERHGLTTEAQNLRDYIKPLFAQSLENYYYDKNQTSLIAKEGEFGNEKLNDHHFHYGYYIRAASILSENDILFFDKVQPLIQEMVSDIATTKRSDTKYPYLRNFDIYEGHSWADGFAKFADGNNIESSSETLNAWYSLYLWAKTTNDKMLKQTSIYLFNTELESIKTYWFDIYNIYPTSYKHSISSIIWGGKVDFSTWFSPQTNMIYGIQLLPFTPASFYLKTVPQFSKYEVDYLNSGGNYNLPWGDLMGIWKSFNNPSQTTQLAARTENFQEAMPRSLYLYFLYYNLYTFNN